MPVAPRMWHRASLVLVATYAWKFAKLAIFAPAASLWHKASAALIPTWVAKLMAPVSVPLLTNARFPLT